MSIKFRAYSDIENNSNKKKLDELKQYGYHEKEWIALEKIHGSNFSFLCDGTNVRVARRSALITDNETFFKSDDVLKKYEKDIMIIFNNIKHVIPDVTMIQVFGEMFGGLYKGIQSKSKPVQKGVYYNTEVDFIIFDIRVDFIDPNTLSLFLSHSEVIKFCERLNINVLRPIHTGTLETLLNLDPVFDSTIHQLYSLPQIPDNHAEGYVLKTNERHILQYDRPILKHKNYAFGEVVKNNNNTNTVPQNIIDKHFQNILSYICQNRFNNVISKEGINANSEKIINLFAIDCVKDYTKTLDSTETDEFKEIDKIIKKNVSQHIRQNKLIDEYMKTFLS
jgi:Rnl2 family RNA ligase